VRSCSAPGGLKLCSALPPLRWGVTSTATFAAMLKTQADRPGVLTQPYSAYLESRNLMTLGRIERRESIFIAARSARSSCMTRRVNAHSRQSGRSRLPAGLAQQHGHPLTVRGSGHGVLRTVRCLRYTGSQHTCCVIRAKTDSGFGGSRARKTAPCSQFKGVRIRNNAHTCPTNGPRPSSAALGRQTMLTRYTGPDGGAVIANLVGTSGRRSACVS